MNDILHGVILQKSLEENFEIEKLFKIIGDNNGIKVVKVIANDLKGKINKLQSVMLEGNWYIHFYDNNDKLIVVFKEKIFYILKSKDTWNSMLEYAESLNIPKEQLEISPLYFKEEESYLND